LDHKVRKEQTDQQATLVLLVRQAFKVRKELKAFKDCAVFKDSQELLVILVATVYKVLKERKVFKVQVVRRVLLVDQVRRAVWVRKD